MEQKSMKSAYAGIFLLAGSIILFEIALTRVFAVMMWHHLTYMAVSIALLGFGAAGSWLTASRETEKTGRPDTSLAVLSSVYGICVMVAFCFVTLVRLDSIRIWQEKQNLAALLLIYLIISVPFLVGGLAIGRALTRFSHAVNRLYFADLVGSAAGGCVSVLFLKAWGGPTTIIAAGAIGTMAGIVFNLGGRRSAFSFTIPTCILALVITVGFMGGGGGIPSIEWPVPFAPLKEMGSAEVGMPEMRISSATAEVEIGTEQEGHPFMGGNFGVIDAKPVRFKPVTQDGTAPTTLYRDAADLSQFPFLDDAQAASSYLAHRVCGGENPVRPNVLVIGVGGGVDVMVALAHDARKVTAVEINSAMIEMVVDHYDDYLGGLFTGAFEDRLELVNEEGRSFMRRQDEQYDIIQMSGVDSFTALSTGAYTLSESYLYTTEAIHEFYDHLTDGGYINYSRFIMNAPQKPRETLRLANIARRALEEIGIENPESHIAVFQGVNWASTMIKKGPFTQDEIDALRDFAVRQELFEGFVFNPLHDGNQPFPLPATLCKDLVSYFSEALQGATGLSKHSPDIRKVAFQLVQAVDRNVVGREAEGAACIQAALGSLRALGKEIPQALIDGVINSAVKQAVALETPFLEKRRIFSRVLTGSESERSAYTESYPYNISPCSDDHPFFFDYYRFEGLWKSSDNSISDIDERYHSEFPVGHMVLLASMIQISILALLLIIFPIRRLRAAGIQTSGKWSYLLYFAALGMGFMFIEIVLMQKMVIFLGHPTYALSVVLTTLLGAAGLGSFVAGYIPRLHRRALYGMMIAIVGMIFFESWATTAWLEELLSLSLTGRILVCIGMMAPLGFVLGMPFPSGLRILRSRAPELLPWGWAVNGFFSVFSSILCIVLSQSLGFTTVLYIGAAIYVVGFLFMRTEAVTTPSPDEISVSSVSSTSSSDPQPHNPATSSPSD